jgi:hypothetical protein
LQSTSPGSDFGVNLLSYPDFAGITGEQMYITKVRVHELTSEVVKSRHSAVVLLENEGGQISLHTSVMADEGIDPAVLAEALLNDAIRQLARLPEYRTGATPITLAEDALDGTVEGA